MSESTPQQPRLATRVVATLVVAEVLHFFAMLAMVDSWDNLPFSLLYYLEGIVQGIILDAAIGLVLAQWVAWKARVNAFALPWHQCLLMGAAFLILLFAVFRFQLVFLSDLPVAAVLPPYYLPIPPSLAMNAVYLGLTIVMAVAWVTFLVRKTDRDGVVEYRRQSMLVTALLTWLALWGGLSYLLDSVYYFRRVMYQLPDTLELFLPILGGLGFAIPIVAGVCWRFPKSMTAPHLFRVLGTIVISIAVAVGCLFGVITVMLFGSEAIYGAIAFRPGVGFTLLVEGLWAVITAALSAVVATYLLPGEPTRRQLYRPSIVT